MRKLFIAVACCLVFGCMQPSPTPSSEQVYLYFERADIHSLVAHDPVVLARDDLGKGKIRFLGVAGFSVEAPGIDIDLCRAPPVHVYIIGGTSDVDPLNLLQRARQFALQYNLTVRGHLVQKGVLKSFLECHEKRTSNTK